ncbi:ABC transporter permease subunit (plasmid) [Embleya sp. NBC_00888]|uniref:ABC transporter permease n=1 Tax=Embleya sp. NBC_00888 TaxID=2975960 RepID=UPI00386678A7|nr:ABC transporter permease subunit [Embleya sp. NBC_00888]
MAAVIAYPAVEMFRTSAVDVDRIGLSHGFAGLGNYRTLLDEPALPGVVRNTVTWVVVVVGTTVLVSLALAQFLDKRFVGRRLVRWSLIVPWASSLVMTATIWRYLFERDYGLLNRLLMDLGFIGGPVDWYKDPDTAFWCLVFVGIVVSIPFTTYVVLAGLQTIPAEVYEAAQIDGAGPWKTYRSITLPLLRPSLRVALVLNTIYVFNSFPIIWLITGKIPGNDTDTTVTFMYKLAFTYRLDPGEAAALAVLNVLVLLALVVWYTRRNQTDDGIAAPPPGRLRRLAAAVAAHLPALPRPPRRPTRLRARRRSTRPQRGRARVRALWRPVRAPALSAAGLVVAGFFLAPYTAMLLAALKSDQDLFSSPAGYLPTSWQWHNFADVWDKIPLASYLTASLVIALASTALVLLVSVPAAYCTARIDFRGKRVFLNLILATQMFAPVALLVGLYRQFVLVDDTLKGISPDAGAINSYWAIIAVNAAFNLAFSIWILHGFFASIPKEVEEAAMLDGLGRFRTLVRVVLPLARPGVVTATIFTFIQVWNEFVVALTLFNDPTRNRATLTVGVQQFVGLYKTEYQYLFVAALIAIAPVVVLFALIERHLVGGLTAGSVK